MTQTQENEHQWRPVKRTICIGLGGTGRDVLMRIRKLIVETYGDLTELPIVSFVHIDTDKGARQVSGLRTGNVYHGVDLTFRDAETVAANMTKIEINTLVQGLETRGIYEQQGPYDHIARWFPPHLLKDLKAIEDGANGIRPVGRLAFFHNYRQIKKAIEKAENRTRQHQEALLTKGYIVEPGLNIFVVGSLCGGTGSGMFLDVAYSLRRDYGDQGAQIYAYLVMSPELYGGTPYMYANTYAALKELNHYATPGIRFETCYDQQNLAIIQEERPPFEDVYLISNQTLDDYKILNKSKLCNVIAHKIILDFSGEIAPLLSAEKDNVHKFMLFPDEHPRPNVQRYLTFGLAEIYLPRDISVQVALNLICLKLVKFWLNGEGQSPDTQDLLDRFLLNWQGDKTSKDSFSLKLEAISKDGNKSFINTINNWRDNLETEIYNCNNKDQRLVIMQQLPGEFRQQFRKVEPGETENTRGMWLTIIKQSRQSLQGKYKQDIDQFLAEILNPSNAEFSINSARAWLEALLTHVNKYQRDLEEKVQIDGGTYRLEDISQKWKESEQLLKDIDNKRGLPCFNKQKNSKFREEAIRIVRKIYNLTKDNFDATLAQEALEIVKELKTYVQNLANQASNLNNLVKNLQSFYETRDSELKGLNDDDMSGQAIFSEQDMDDCYHTILPDNELRSSLVAVSKQVTEKVVLGDSLSSFINRDRLVEETELTTEIYATVDRLFGVRSLNMVQSVVKRFMHNYASIAERSMRLEQIMTESKPLLPLNLADPYFFNDPGKNLKIIAFKDVDEPEVNQFKNLLTNALAIPDSVIKPIQAEDKILIINEYGAFPLRLINGLEQMRQKYERQQNQGSSFLHNEYRVIFTDVIPPDARKIEQLQDIFYPCLAFKLLVYNRENHSYQFEYFESQFGTTETAGLSPIWLEAIEQLSKRKDMVLALQNMLEQDVIAKIKAQKELWEEIYLPQIYKFNKEVDNLPEDNPNYPYRAMVIGAKATATTSAKPGIIDRFRRRIEGELSNIPTLNPSHDITSTPVITDKKEVIEAEYFNDNQDAMGEIDKLIAMKEKGYLTNEEFQAAKKRILGL